MEKQRDLSLDFTRGIGILFVILSHNLPNYYILSAFWNRQAVPLLAIITAGFTYAAFQRGRTLEQYYSKKTIIKKFKKIFAPFLIVILIQCTITYFLDPGFDIKDVIRLGGMGPGSYFPWCYLQYWLYLPLIIWLVDTLSIKKSFIIILSICICYEILCCIINIDPLIYRLLSFRYLVILYLGCIVRKLNLKINPIIMILALAGFIYLFLVSYANLNTEPFLLNVWETHHWPSAFYALFLFLFISTILYKKVNHLKISDFITKIGSYSYEIFICQMFIFTFLGWDRLNKGLAFIDNLYVRYTIFVIVTTCFSIAPIYIYKTRIKNIIFRK